MNKKFIAFALVLLIAMGGLFAAVTVALPANAVATLTANRGEFLSHGFKKGDLKYQGDILVEDAFETDPEFEYGYKTNAKGSFEFRMHVGNFEHTSTTGAVVKIAKVEKNGVVMPVTTEGDFVLFTRVNSDVIVTGSVEESATFKIVPAKEAGVDYLNTDIANGQYVSTSPTGSYVSYVTISVTGS